MALLTSKRASWRGGGEEERGGEGVGGGGEEEGGEGEGEGGGEERGGEGVGGEEEGCNLQQSLAVWVSITV